MIIISVILIHVCPFFLKYCLEVNIKLIFSRYGLQVSVLYHSYLVLCLLQERPESHSSISLSYFAHQAIVKCLTQHQLAIPAISLQVTEKSVCVIHTPHRPGRDLNSPPAASLPFTRLNEPLPSRKKLRPIQGEAVMEYSVENHIKSYWQTGNRTLRCKGTDLIGWDKLSWIKNAFA